MHALNPQQGGDVGCRDHVGKGEHHGVARCRLQQMLVAGGIDSNVGLRYLRLGVDRSGGGARSWPFGASRWKKRS
jgi:hypothetical protein